MNNIKHYVDGDRTLTLAMLVGTVIGALLGIAVFGRDLIFPQWQQIMAPPEKAVGLLAFHSNGFKDTLYIRTVLGNIYAYGPASSGASDAEWRKVEQVNREESSYECKLGKFPTPNPPGRTVGQLESHPCIVDAESQVNHIILEDSSIWRWEKTTGELDLLLGLLLIPVGVVYAGIGGALGAVAGMVVGLVTLLQRKKKRSSS